MSTFKVATFIFMVLVRYFIEMCFNQVLGSASFYNKRTYDFCCVSYAVLFTV